MFPFNESNGRYFLFYKIFHNFEKEQAFAHSFYKARLNKDN